MTHQPAKSRQVPPRASAMLEALRGLGYSTATALADIVDNSISAKANEVRIEFVWEGGASRILVLDDGCGMSDSELESAMRLGDRSPLESRDSSDLGRFGMGLKTASLSQCRRLTVASIKYGEFNCLRWDLDELAVRPSEGWLLFEGAVPSSEEYLKPLLDQQKGTLILWEVLDRIVTDGYDSQDFLDLIDQVERHLSMVFHRLLEGSAPKLKIILNGRIISPWDPFMTGHVAKLWHSPIARKNTLCGLVEVECHVLPHRDRLTAKDYDFFGGPDGWTAQQGFYIYRNERLLVAGSWLGLGRGRAWIKDESHRLARIRLDIPNTSDADWKIDIRKSRAQPPVSLRPWLSALAEDTRDRARKVFAFRGSSISNITGASVVQVWNAEQARSGTRYKIDVTHPAVAAVLDAAKEHRSIINAMIRIIEETVPVQRIWLDTAENKDVPQTGFMNEPPEQLMEVLQAMYADMVCRRNMLPEVAKQTLSTMEPFQKFPDLIGTLAENGDS